MTYTTLKGAILAEKVDWIAYSQALNLEWGFPDYIDGHWKIIKPIKHYNHAEENKQGVRRFWNDQQIGTGRHVVLAGAASGILQDNQLNFLQWVNTTDRKATRIDYAIDILHSKFTPQVVRRHLLAGEAVTHARSKLRMGEIQDDGDTQFVGRKSSETYTRIYDKAAEQHVSGKWTRIETVYQGERAKPSLAAYCECQSTRPLISRHINFPQWADWIQIMSNSVVEFSSPQRETATKAWLLSQVAKAMAKELQRDEDHLFWFSFQEAVRQELEELDKRQILDTMSRN